MKVYNLICSNHHAFEGWFASAEDFQEQSDQQRIQCPVCESVSISRVPSAPRLNLSGTADQSKHHAAVKAMQESLGELARQVIANTEDVGDAFAEEARKIHYKESPDRAIRGLATASEREALADEGIEVMALPTDALPKTSLH